MKTEPDAHGKCAITLKHSKADSACLPKRVLVVDDDRQMLILLAQYMSRLGYEVDLAADGREAFDLFRTGRFGLVVTDLQMPVLDGRALLEKIKSLSHRTPVVVITGQSAKQVERDGGVTRAAAILHKPFELGELEDTLHRVFDSS